MDISSDKRELYINKPFAEIQEVKNIHNTNVLRVYCNLYPDSFTFQIRTHGGIGEYGGGKHRDMIATVNLSREEVQQILDQMNHYAENHEYMGEE